jgi:hypothetical protein
MSGCKYCGRDVQGHHEEFGMKVCVLCDLKFKNFQTCQKILKCLKKLCGENSNKNSIPPKTFF